MTSVATGALVRPRFPSGPPAPLETLLAGLTDEPPGGRLSVGDRRILDFLVAFSRRLLVPSVARRHPELGSLGYFLRRAELHRTAQRLRQAPPGAVAFPRGAVFHVPPANVDTIFVYSWALSALAGNRNVVRISQRSAGAAQTVLDLLDDTLAEADPVVPATQLMLTYGRDDAVTAHLSAGCDLRVVWGGDEAVRAVRRHPLAPSARDLTFPDRASFAAISVDRWHTAHPSRRRQAAEGFANDSYWFDQAACASPRTVFLVGDPQAAREVRDELLALLAKVVAAHGWQVDPAMAVQKRVATYGLAAEGDATRVDFTGNAVAGLDLTAPAAAPRRWLGAGTFPFATVPDLAALVPLLGRRDQTFSHFGFTEQELTDFAHALGGRGIDRIVPFGSALSFAAVWDGYDLLREFTRYTTVTA